MHTISYLELVNVIVDLCIDSELFDVIYNKEKDNTKKKDDVILTLNEKAKNFLVRFRDNGKTDFAELVQEDNDLPLVTKVYLPNNLISSHEDLVENQSLLQFGVELIQNPQAPLLKRWSYLFLAKSIRAVIQENSKKPWIDRYDDLILFLEVRMPRQNEAGCCKEKEFKRTLFNFLMELSATDSREASYGYAERARNLLNEIFPQKDDKERGYYDRWISLNKGIAYQHTGRLQKAVLEFNYIIKKFREDNKNKSSWNSHQVFEFLFNIYRAILQRASISLRLQLGYHALETLEEIDDNERDCLRTLKQTNSSLFKYVADNLRNRCDLFKLEGLLQLEQLGEAERQLGDLIGRLFPDSYISVSEGSLPKHNPGASALQTELVEQIVSLNKGKLRELLILLKRNDHYKNKEDTINLDGHVEFLVNILISIKDVYWEWVKDNYFDERIYFSKWAQVLGVSANIYKELKKSQKNLANKIILAVIKLYLYLRDKLPNGSSSDQVENRLRLENFRSDDLPDFLNGLRDFYKVMQNFISSKDYRDASSFPELKEILKEKDPHALFEPFETDHLKLLDALDKYEKEFGENQKISSLKRCNERLIWLDDTQREVNSCNACLDNEWGVNAKINFKGLLHCKSNSSYCGNVDSSRLNWTDYETIIQGTEEHLTKHLKDPSLQGTEKESLHFFGLQRWNSLTPAQGRSVGGGYFIYKTNKKSEISLGIAIDPGFDFVRNLFRMGFSLMDIDIVLISHAHPDHLWDFESVIHLLHELDVKEKITHRVNVILSLGSYRRLEHIICNSDLRRYINPIVIDIRKEIEDDFLNRNYKFYLDTNIKHDGNGGKFSKPTRWNPVLPGIGEDVKKGQDSENISIKTTLAYHDDKSERSDSFGFLIDFQTILSPNPGKDVFCFGYTGDTKWVGNDLYNEGCPGFNKFKSCECQNEHKKTEPHWLELTAQYKNCDVLLLHIGSLIDHKQGKHFIDYNKSKECEILIREKNHPYLLGIIRLLKKLRDYNSGSKPEKLILIGEFGEELRGGIRIDLVNRLQGGITPDWPIIPVDVGLDILMFETTDENPKKEVEQNIKDSVSKYKFLCTICEKPRPLDKIKYHRFGQDEAIFYICETCEKATPTDVRDLKLRNIYEVGKELKTLIYDSN